MDFRIKEICKERGMLFKELAGQLGITDIALRQSLQGNPTVGTLDRIAKVLDVEVSELFAPPKQGSITCPHCGKEIRIKVEK